MRLFGDDALLVVQHGAVRISTQGQKRQVDAGQQLRWNLARLPLPVPALPGADAWVRGMLVADAMPLQQVLQELGRYQHRWLRVDPHVAGLPVSGAFPLDDLQRSLSMLAATHALRIEQGLWIHVSAAGHRG